MAITYIQMEGRITRAKSQIEATRTERGSTYYFCGMRLSVDINGKEYYVPIKGSWPFEKGNDIRLFFGDERPDNPTMPDLGSRPVTLADLEELDTLRPSKVEKIADGEVVFEYEDDFPWV